jgi:hypothetical protein
MSNVVRFPAKAPLARDLPGVSLPDLDLLAAESYRQCLELIAASLRQIEPCLIECRHALETMSEAAEKRECMKLVAEAEINVREQLARCVAIAGPSGTDEWLV